MSCAARETTPRLSTGHCDMNADTYHLIRRHDDGGYGVVLAHLGDRVEPTLTTSDPHFATLDEALDYADTHESCFGVCVHEECSG